VYRILSVLLFRNLLLRLVNDEIQFCRVHSRVLDRGGLSSAFVLHIPFTVENMCVGGHEGERSRKDEEGQDNGRDLPISLECR